ISCNTFYYQLGWDMEEQWGAANGDGSEKFQDFLRLLGFDNPTGVDLPGEIGGVVPDETWLEDLCAAYREQGITSEGCDLGWLPGYSVNMSIGQGDLIVTPLQMAVNYASVVNGGRVLQPRVGDYFGEPPQERSETEPLPTVDPLVEVTATPSPTASATPTTSATPGVSTPSASPTPETGAEARTSLDEEKVVGRIKTKTLERLPLDETELAILRQGLEDVVMGDEGTAAGAFAGFPLDQIPIAGKTGTAQIGETELNRAWFVSYAPADDPQYVVAVYLNYAGHGGESAAPVAREIFEGIFNLDQSTGDVLLGQDASG
ncbi:MAG: penicillin-binding transpeptidase domain-containing protein, partial [Actinomycetota bacterium]